MTTATPVSGTRMTLDEWLSLPYDEEFRSELLDGLLVVTSAPSWPHQIVVTELLIRLHAACPPELRVVVGPLGVLVRDLTSGLMPDLLVVRDEDRASLDRLPVLVVEVLSPSTRGRDLREKRRLYEHRGIASYWIVDPLIPALTVLELGAGGRYVGIFRVEGADELAVSRPFPLRLRPADLLT